ncbi:hypothetical protein ACFX12_033167 [Malus domestica]
MLWRAKAHKPKIASTRSSKVRPVLHNYSATRRYYHQPGDQKYAQYSKIIRQPAAITTKQVMKCTTRTLLHATNQVIKSTPSTSYYTWALLMSIIHKHS